MTATICCLINNHPQATFRHLFAHCARALQVGPALKIEHALQTMQTMLYALSRKRYNDFAAEVRFGERNERSKVIIEKINASLKQNIVDILF
jgi:hypothetical protein